MWKQLRSSGRDTARCQRKPGQLHRFLASDSGPVARLLCASVSLSEKTEVTLMAPLGSWELGD